MQNECEACKVICPIGMGDKPVRTKLTGIVLYSTNCPRCSVLERKLTQLGIEFEKKTEVEEMIALGMTQAPMLSVDGELLDFKAANEWLNKHNQEDHTT